MNALILSVVLATTAPTLGGDWTEQDRPVELRFEGELRDALRELAEAAGWDLVLSADTELLDETRVTVSVRDAEADRVLLNLLEPHGLRAERSGGLVRILPAEETAQKRPRKRSHKERVRFGGDVEVAADESFGDVVAIGGNLQIAGDVKDAVAVGGDVHVTSSGEVRGDAVSVGGRLVIDPGGQVAGDRVEVGAEHFGRGVVDGLLGIREAHTHWEHWRTPFRWLRGVALFLVCFVLGLIVVAIAPSRMLAVGEALWRRPLTMGLWGLGGAVASALLLALLCVTLIGIPLVPLVAVGIVLAVFAGFTALALRLGSVLPIGAQKSAALSLALGTAMLVVVQYVPFVGWPLMWLASFFCFGAVLSTRFGARGRTPPPGPEPAPPSPPDSVNPPPAGGSERTQGSAV